MALNHDCEAIASVVRIGVELGNKPHKATAVFVRDCQKNEIIDILSTEILVDIVPTVVDFMHNIGGYLGRSGAVRDLGI